jgi:uncharacterized membrane-anchored protein
VKNIYKLSVSSIISIFPALLFAAEVNTSYVDSFFTGAGKILNAIVIFLISLSVVWFMWNVIKYSMSDDEGDKEKAKGQMVSGIIAITVAVSIWGLVTILRTTFGLNTNNAADGPSDSINYLIPKAEGVDQ